MNWIELNNGGEEDYCVWARMGVHRNEDYGVQEAFGRVTIS